MKPWKTEPRGIQLEAFVGAFGVRTSDFATTDMLIRFACELFEIDPEGVDTAEDAATRIEALGKKQRSARARRSRVRLLPADYFAPKTGAKDAPGEMAITKQGLSRMMDASRPHLVDGQPFGVDGDIDIDPAKLLRKVVSAVVSADQAHILWEFPDVLAFFGARIPASNDPA